ncbi:hypothetical protein, partial [Lacinutrix salivirga]
VVTPGGSFDFSTPVTDGALIDMATGEVTMGTPSATYIIEYTTNGACPTTTAFSLTLLPSEDSSFSYTPSCEGGLVTTEATPGGTYIWTVPAPTDGALLDSATGAITSGIPGATYSVDYTTNGACPSTSTSTVTAYSLPTVVAPTDLEVCDDGTPDGMT